MQSINIKVLWLSLAHIKLKLWSASGERWLVSARWGGTGFHWRDKCPQRAGPRLTSWAVASWGVALAGGEAAGCRKQGGEKPKCSYNPGWSFSDLSFESLWLGSSVLHFLPQPRANRRPALSLSTWNLLGGGCWPVRLQQTLLQGPSPWGPLCEDSHHVADLCAWECAFTPLWLGFRLPTGGEGVSCLFRICLGSILSSMCQDPMRSSLNAQLLDLYIVG